MRNLKIILAAFVGMFCVFYAVQNLVNLKAAHGFVVYVAGMADHNAYPAHFGPAVTSSALTWLMLFIIIALELAAGVLAAVGAYKLFVVRKGSADVFNSAKTLALAGCGAGIVVWFGLFSAIAGPYFQMWQTDAGLNALRDASMFSIQLGVILIIIAMKDE